MSELCWTFKSAALSWKLLLVSGRFESSLKPATTPGTSSIRDTFETVSERIIRQLSANAQWEPNSRPASPPPLGSAFENSHFSTQGGSINPSEIVGAEGMPQDPIMGIANPFDSFLLHPLGGISGDDWAKALASVMEYEEDPFGTQNLT